MHILYIHQYFKTPEEGGAIRSYYLARGLIADGHQVSMVTAHNKPYYQRQDIEGIQVHYLPVFYSQHLPFRRRIIAFLKFVIKAVRLCKNFHNINLCYASSTPLTVGIIALFLKWRKNIPYFFEVRDLWPEAPIHLGVIKSGILKRILYRYERLVYHHATKLLALAPPVRDYLLQFKSRENVHYIPNMADCYFFYPHRKTNIEHLGNEFTSNFVITYFGALGQANQLENFLEIAEECQPRLSETRFLVVGDGSKKETLIQLAKYKGLKNLQFLPFQNKEGVREILHITDAVFISYSPDLIFTLSSPNKMFDGLAAGKLCITNTGGWIEEVLENHQAGFLARSPEIFIEKLKPILKDKSLLSNYQKNARKLAEEKFSREKWVNQWIKLFNNSGVKNLG